MHGDANGKSKGLYYSYPYLPARAFSSLLLMKKTTATQRIDRIIEILFSIIAFGIIAFCIVGYIVFPDETQKNIFKCQRFETEWYRVNDDGSKESVKVPGICSADRNEKVTITIT